MRYFERDHEREHGEGRGRESDWRERWERQPSRSDRFLQGEDRWEPRERRPFGNEDFDQERERWREPMEAEPRTGAPRREAWGRYAPHPREWWRSERYPGPYHGKGPKGYRRSDARILEDVNEALQDCGALDASEIEVACQGGEIVLKGSVQDRRSKRIAEEIAEEQSGVSDVRNEIRIGTRDRHDTEK